MTHSNEPQTLEQRLRAAFASRAAATTIHEPRCDAITAARIDLPVSDGRRASWWAAAGSRAANTRIVYLTRPRRSGGRRRRVVAAAAIVVIVGGVLAGTHLAANPKGRVQTGAPPSDSSVGTTGPATGDHAQCGSELPFTFPAPAGYEGPLPGPSEAATSQSEPPPDGLMLHWQAADGTIDVRWPSYPPLDPQTPPESPDPETPDESIVTVFEQDPRPTGDGRTTQQATFVSGAIGSGPCSAVDVTVASDDATAAGRLQDQIEIALVGPGGVLAGPAPALVTGSRTADTLPDVAPCRTQEPETPATVSGTPRDLGTYPTPRDALTFFLATEPRLSQRDYEEITLPDGSLGYAYRAEPNRDVVTVIHIVRSGEGWAVGSWQASSC
jgi:hypothetical protein